MEKIISRDGTIIGYVKSGTGPPLLLVHGTTADHRRWSRISPHLEKHFTVYAMDRRGRGESTDSPDYHLIREAEDIAAVLEAIGEKVYILAHSYGAICSLEASLLSDKISRLILYEPPILTNLPLYPPGLPDRMDSLIQKNELEAALEVFIREVVRMPDYEFEEYRKSPMWKIRISLAPTIPREIAYDRYYSFKPENYANQKIPALLLLGGDSPPLFSKATEAVHAALQHSRIVILPGQKHIAMDMVPELFVSEVLKFLLE